MTPTAIPALQTVSGIPFTAWEQAALVGLFIVFAIGLLRWVSKLLDKQQTFFASLNENWKSWLKEQKDADRTVNNDVAIVLKSLCEKLEAHDNNVEVHTNRIIDAVEDRKAHTEPKSKPAHKKEDLN